MAKIVEQLAVIKISKLAKDSDAESLAIFTPEVANQLIEVLEELLGDGAVVELETGE